MRGDVMALAQAVEGPEAGERRWAEWWALPSHDVALGAALLALFDGWDGDDSMVSHSVHEQFKALDRRLIAYEDWCDELGFEPARRPVERSLRIVGDRATSSGRCCVGTATGRGSCATTTGR